LSYSPLEVFIRNKNVYLKAVPENYSTNGIIISTNEKTEKSGRGSTVCLSFFDDFRFFTLFRIGNVFKDETAKRHFSAEVAVKTRESSVGAIAFLLSVCVPLVDIFM